MSGTIEFKALNGKFGGFSNFAVINVEMKGYGNIITAEHYFQAMKFEGVSAEYQALILKSSSPMKAKMLGAQDLQTTGRFGTLHLLRDKTTPRISALVTQYAHLKIREDWDDVRIDVMRTILKAKFALPRFAKLLKDSGSATIVESSRRDGFWGNALPHAKNNLGKLLMEIRAEL